MKTLAPYLAQSPPAVVWLAHATIGASLLILGVLVFRGFFGKRLPAGILYAAGGVVLIRLALPLTPQSSLSVYAPSTADSMPDVAEVAPESEATEAPLWHDAPEPMSVAFPAVLPETPRLLAKKPAAPDPSPRRLPPIPFIVYHTWLAGVALCLLLNIARYLRLRRWARCQPECRDRGILRLIDECQDLLELSNAPCVRVVDRLRSAAVFGILKPEILLPRTLLETLDHTELRHVLLHELAHIQRRDPLVGTAAHLILALHWFNPLVWVTVRHFTADREVLCDAAVLRCLGQQERRPYGETLLHVLRLAPPPHPTGTALLPFLSNKPEIKRRLTMIAKTKTTRSLPGVLATTTVFAVLSLTLAAAPAQDREREGEKDKPEAREGDREREKAPARDGDGEREKAQARERDGEARKPEARDGERAEMMRAREQEVHAIREEIGRLAREGKREEAERLEVELREKLNRFRIEASEIERPGANRGQEPSVEAIRAEIGRLAREGKREQAEQLENRLRIKLEGLRTEGRVPDRPVAEVRPGNAPQLERHIVELTEIVRDLQHSMREMREEIRQLREERKAGE